MAEAAGSNGDFLRAFEKSFNSYQNTYLNLHPFENGKPGIYFLSTTNITLIY